MPPPAPRQTPGSPRCPSLPLSEYDCILNGMPKIVDAQARRRETGAAVLSLLQRRGVEAISIRTVAAEAGCSAGAVQAYFPTRRHLLDQALELSTEAFLARLDAVDPAGPPREVLRRYLLAYLPLDAERRAHALVWAAFAGYAAYDQPTAAACREVDAEVRDALAGFIASCAAPDLDPYLAADLLLAATDGIALRLLYGAEPGPLLE